MVLPLKHLSSNMSAKGWLPSEQQIQLLGKPDNNRPVCKSQSKKAPVRTPKAGLANWNGISVSASFQTMAPALSTAMATKSHNLLHDDQEHNSSLLRIFKAWTRLAIWTTSLTLTMPTLNFC